MANDLTNAVAVSVVAVADPEKQMADRESAMTKSENAMAKRLKTAMSESDSAESVSGTTAKSAAWTPARKAKAAEAIRRWKPWEKSTGPRTPEGKARSSMNRVGRYTSAAEMFRWAFKEMAKGVDPGRVLDEGCAQLLGRGARRS